LAKIADSTLYFYSRGAETGSQMTASTTSQFSSANAKLILQRIDTFSLERAACRRWETATNFHFMDAVSRFAFAVAKIRISIGSESERPVAASNCRTELRLIHRHLLKFYQVDKFFAVCQSFLRARLVPREKMQ